MTIDKIGLLISKVSALQSSGECVYYASYPYRTKAFFGINVRKIRNC